MEDVTPANDKNRKVPRIAVEPYRDLAFSLPDIPLIP